MPVFDFSECNCLAARKAARRLTLVYDAKLAPCGIKTSQLTILAAIDRKGELTVNDLAEIMVLDRTTTGKNLKPMERDGYLKSVVSKTDRRSRSISLTGKGKTLLAQAYPLWKSAHEQFQRKHGAKFAADYREMLREVTEA
ncbi:MarR family winged helix-turn-helix transcriptional regulator [Bradyrhizobium genosp. P]|uniref:MarR family winged helix-turn-helix transcriptional regulator n=1 Tax=Bradyrhizobium genosp. P TaxID=83641 RepID=UPI003CF7179E